MSDATPKKDLARPRIRWWDRLEARVVLALFAMGLLCVGAFTYLVHLSAEYFEGIGDVRESEQAELAELAQHFYENLAAEKRKTLQLWTDEKLREFERGPFEKGTLSNKLKAAVESRPDLSRLALRLKPEGVGETLAFVYESSLPSGGSRSVDSKGKEGGPGVGLIEIEAESQSLVDSRLSASFLLRSDWTRNVERVAQIRRRIGKVEVGEGKLVRRTELRRALVLAVSVGGVVVFFVASVVGVWITRRTTRRISTIGKVMRKVAQGESAARVRDEGRGEVGLLSSDFNQMLDDLEQAEHRIKYLERIEAWREMARRIAHEIKNPLTPIQLAVQQLREKDPQSNREFSRLLNESAEIVEDEVEGLRRMVTSFSQFARLPDVQHQSFELRAFLEDFRRAQMNLIGEDDTQIDLQWKLKSNEFQLNGDRQLLRQALVNLVENALLSSKEARIPEVRLIIFVRMDENSRLEFGLEDNGPGIDEGWRERVFEPYMTTREEGTGLGLAIVKKVVLDHGWQIRVAESPAGGAAFIIQVT